MSKDSSKSGQQDKSDGEYKPPSSPGLCANQDEINEYLKDKQDYDKAWEVTKAQQDQAKDKYDPPPKPNILDDEWKSNKKWNERESYNKSWDDSQDNSDSQKEEKSGGCFITSACVEAHGLPDNCTELKILRNFRDTFLIQLPDGNNLVQQYYNTAPKIVDNINRSSKKAQIYQWLYEDLIQKSILYIKTGDNIAAFKNYKSIFEYLKQTFLDKK